MAKKKESTEKLQQVLKQDHNLCHKYLNLAGVIIIALDKSGNITLLNKKGYETLGYKKEELIGKNWYKTCIPKGKQIKVRKDLEKFMKGKIENVLSNIKSNSIDTFIMCNVIEHLNDVPKLLNRLYSKLKGKGRILISTDDGDNPMGGLMAQLNHTEHTVTLTKNAFDILCKGKFKITKYWNVSDYLIYTVLEKE